MALGVRSRFAQPLLVTLLIFVCVIPPQGPGAILLPPPAFAQTVPIPALAQWQANMVSIGQTDCALVASEATNYYQTHTAGDGNDDIYYDAERVFYQIADYTGTTAQWTSCAHIAQGIYRDQYVIPQLQNGPNNYGVPGYTVFTTGLRMDYERTRDPLSQGAVFLLSLNAAFAPDSTPLSWTVSADYSREVAYAIVSYINAQALGQAPRQRRIDLVNQAYGHLDQWFVNFSWPRPSPVPAGTPGPWPSGGTTATTSRLAPFMVGLTAHTLIRDWEQTQDARLIPALERAADWMWANAWVAADHGFWEDSTSISLGGMPDDDLIIAPLYAFLYWQTGQTKYRDEGDQIFASGVQYAYNGDGKHFDRSYYWSFDYVKWRSLSPMPPAGPSLSVTPATVNFGSVTVGGSANGSFTVTNSGGGTLTGTASTAAPFSMVSGGSFSLSGGASQAVIVMFSPTAAGSFTGSVTFTSNGGTASVAVTGNGTSPAPALSVSPTALNFGSVAAGGSANGSLTVTNSGGGTLTGTVSTAAPFSVVSGGSFSLSGGASQAVIVMFSPIAAGSFTGSVTFTSNGGPASVAVTGTGTSSAPNAPALSISAANLNFGSVAVGVSTVSSLTATNTGGGTLTGTVSTAAPFSVVSGGSFSLPGGTRQTVVVMFSPTAVGTFTRSVTFTSNGGPASVAVTGNGTSSGSTPTLSVTPSTVDFGSVAVGVSTTSSFTVTNNSGGTLTGIASTAAPFSVVSGGSFSLSGGTSQRVVVQFSPTTSGNFTGNLNFTSNGGLTAVALTGSGTSPSSGGGSTQSTGNGVGSGAPPTSSGGGGGGGGGGVGGGASPGSSGGGGSAVASSSGGGGSAGGGWAGGSPSTPRVASVSNARRTRPVSWTGAVNVAVVGNSLRKISGCRDCHDAGAISREQIIAGDGYLEFTASEPGTRRLIGLTTGNPGTNPSMIRFAISLWPSGGADIREYGVYSAGTSYLPGDTFRITIETDTVRYYKNGRLLYTSSLAPAYPLRVAASLMTLGATMSNAIISGTISTGSAWPAGTTSLPAVRMAQEACAISQLGTSTGNGCPELAAFDIVNERRTAVGAGNFDRRYSDI